MPDPLAQIVELLQPSPSFTKLVEGAGSWLVRRGEVGRPFYCAVLDGSFQLAVPGSAPIVLVPDDFVLLSFATSFTLSSLDRPTDDRHETIPVELRSGVFRLGDQTAEPTVRTLVGYGEFESDDMSVLVSLLPPVVHVRGERRLTTLVKLLDQEARSNRPARDVVLTRLLEILLIEALRSCTGSPAPPGLLRGLADGRLVGALRGMHERPAESTLR